MGENSCHNAIYITTQHAGNIGNAFAFAELDLVGRQVQCLASQVQHGDFEGNPRAQGRFLKDHAQCLTHENGLIAPCLPFLFQFLGYVQDVPDLFCRQVSQAQKVFLH